MNVSTHPDTDSLLGFLEKPQEPEYADLSLHLARCATCRDELIQLSALTQELIHFKRSNPPDQQTAASQFEAPERLDKLHGITSGAADSTQHQSFMKAMENDKDLLRSTLHFVTHSEAMKRDLPPGDADNHPMAAQRDEAQDRPQHSGMGQTLRRYLSAFTWQPPVWSAAALTALLVLSVGINLQYVVSNQNGDQRDMQVIAYQDNPVVTFTSQQDQVPGIGFFNAINTSTQPFSDVHIKRGKDHSLSISWPKLDNVTEYTIRLHRISVGERVLLAEQQVGSNRALFQNLPIATAADTGGGRYEWSLSGVTMDNKAFKASGGFVIGKHQ